MRTLNKTILAVALATVTASAFADDAPAPAATPDFTSTANVSLITDYRVRGISNTFKEPAIQGGFDITHSSGLYIGTWESNVSSTYNPGSSLESDWYGGYRGKITDDLTYDVGAIYFYYPGGTMTNPTENTWEGYAGATYKWFNVKYTQDLTNYFGYVDSKGTNYLEGNVTVALPAAITMLAHYGEQNSKGAQYLSVNGFNRIDDWKLAFSKDMVGVTWTAGYMDTNRTVLSTEGTTTKNLSNGEFYASVGKTF
ncbi:TorF family putative porin [Sulfuriferula nivalis]|uniref:Exported protein n=1 Tax=Sulfuriferula nivalis TaxID=2675298 RepID=A0A809RCT7_9PROT|nr:TorF family putative porin [Sulfuriferula nivalis]BBO99454.1 exported protein [Sulfuriferula nivalis]